MKEANVLTVDIIDLIEKYKKYYEEAYKIEDVWLMEEIIEDLTKLKDKTLTN